MVAAGEGAGEAEGHQHRLRPRGREAHDLDAGQQPAEPLGQLGLARMLCGIDLPQRQRRGHGIDDRLRRMAQDGRAVAQHVVDMHVAIDVVEPCALAAFKEQRYRRGGIAHVAADAARAGVFLVRS